MYRGGLVSTYGHFMCGWAVAWIVWVVGVGWCEWAGCTVAVQLHQKKKCCFFNGCRWCKRCSLITEPQPLSCCMRRNWRGLLRQITKTKGRHFFNPCIPPYSWSTPLSSAPQATVLPPPPPIVGPNFGMKWVWFHHQRLLLPLMCRSLCEMACMPHCWGAPGSCATSFAAASHVVPQRIYWGWDNLTCTFVSLITPILFQSPSSAGLGYSRLVHVVSKES